MRGRARRASGCPDPWSAASRYRDFLQRNRSRQANLGAAFEQRLGHFRFSVQRGLIKWGEPGIVERPGRSQTAEHDQEAAESDNYLVGTWSEYGGEVGGDQHLRYKSRCSWNSSRVAHVVIVSGTSRNKALAILRSKGTAEYILLMPNATRNS